MATIREVAKKAGVSISTVSFVLNGKAKKMKVSPQTAAKVKEAADDLGYTASQTAKRLRTSGTDSPLFQIYWPVDYGNFFLAQLIEGITRAVNAIDPSTDIRVIAYRNDFLHHHRELKKMYSYSAAIIGSPSTKDLAYMSSLDPDLPIIILNGDDSCHHAVMADEDTAIGQVANMAASKGIRSAAFFCTKERNRAFALRTNRVLKLFGEAGIEIAPQDIYPFANNCEGGAEAARSFLLRQDPPNLIFSLSDQLAIGAVYEMNRSGYRVPDDSEMICFAIDSPQSVQFSTPSISAIDMPTGEMSRNAVEIAFSLLDPHHKKERQVRSVELAIRLRESFRI